MSCTIRKLTLAEFLTMPESGDLTELINGEIVLEVSPKYKHASVQGRFFRLIDGWCDFEQSGRVMTQWSVVLQRQGQDWVSVPDLTYVSYEKLPIEWEEDEPCPALAELVIEIISPGQSFGEMTSKATNYLLAGVDRVWVVDNQAQSVTVFGASEFPQTFWVSETVSDSLLPGLAIPVNSLFTKTGGRTPDANES